MMLGFGLCRRVFVGPALQCKRLAAPSPPSALLQSAKRAASGPSKDSGEQRKAFNPALLDFLVCPLSRKPLRFEESTNELINDELGIAYPIIDGIPNMIPQDARMIHGEKPHPENEQT